MIAATTEQQLAMPEIPPPPDGYMIAQVKEAYLILSRLNASRDRKLPSNIYLAMAYLHVELAARSPARTD